MIGAVVLTDTELGQLEAAHRRLLGGAVPAAGADGAQGGRAAEACRSLVGRGLLDRSGRLVEDGDAGLLVATLLDLRAAASRVLVAERLLVVPDPGAPEGPSGDEPREGGSRPGVSRGVRLAHLAADGACVEDVLPDGVHHLHLAVDADDVVAALTAAVVPEDAGAGRGGPRRVSSVRPERLAEALDGPAVLAELGLVDGSARTDSHLVALGPRGCWVADLDRARPLPPELVLRPVDPSWVRRWVRDAVEDARDPPARQRAQ